MPEVEIWSEYCMERGKYVRARLEGRSGALVRLYLKFGPMYET